MARNAKSIFGKLWQSLGLGKKSIPLTHRRGARPSIELLEDRCVPATANFGTVTGVVFIDANGNGVKDKTEAVLPGVSVTLVGTSTSTDPMKGNGAIKVTAVTNALGVYKITGVPEGIDSLAPYTYKLVTNKVPGLVNGAAQSFSGVSITSNGQTITHNFGFHTGIAPGAYSLRQFLTNTTLASFPYNKAGTGVNIADHAPTALTIPTQTIATGAADKALDLAAFFKDADMTNSQVTFNIQNGTQAQKLNLTLFDAQAPMNVTNFFDYLLGAYTAGTDSASYLNAIFHRETTVPTDGIGVLQGGGFALANAGGTDLQNVSVNPLGAFFNGSTEFSSKNPNLKGTIAMAQSAANGGSSATNQFFFNTQDNPSLNASLGNSTGPFAVFGKLSDAASMTVLQSMTKGTITDVHTSPDPIAASMSAIPLYNYSGSAATFPGDAVKDNYISISGITINKRDEFLTYSIDGGNTANQGDTPNVASVTLTNEFAMIHAIAAGSTTFHVTVTDRYGLTVTQTFTVTVTGNHAPAADLNGAAGGKDVAVNFTQGTPTAIAPAGTLSDSDNTTLASMTATLTTRPDGDANESLALNASALAVIGSLTHTYNPATGVLSITGSASLSTYQTILQGIVYNNTAASPNSAARIVNVVVSDGSASSLTRTSTISILPEVTVAVSSSPAAEAGGAMTFTFTRDVVTSQAITVNYTATGTATQGTDYNALSGTVTIPANQASATVTVTATEDTLLEGDETVILTVGAGTGYSAGTPSNDTGTITDNESATLDIAATTSVNENGGAQNIPVTLTITGTGSGTFALATGITLTADVIDANTGTAVSGTDYQAFGTQTVTFSPGATSGAVQNATLTPINNGIADGNRSVDLTLQNLGKPLTVSATLGNTSNTTTIVDDE